MLTFRWILLGKVRLAQRQELKQAEYLSEAFLAALERRREKADTWNQTLSEVQPSRFQRIRWSAKALRQRRMHPEMLKYGKDQSYTDRMATLEQEWRCRSGMRSASIPWALNEVVSGFWAGGGSLFIEKGDVTHTSRSFQGGRRRCPNDVAPACQSSHSVQSGRWVLV
jgi:hypothetical protein